jgi:hypothetical protein
MTVPFTYPSTPHARRHGPRGYADYTSYRPWLRDEFSFRCVYCLLREQWGIVRGTFAIDHFLPAAVHAERITDYDNLVYGCAACNSAKGSQHIPDPSRVLLGKDVRVAEDGTIEATTREARRLIRLLGLDDAEYTEFRRMWIEIIALAARYDADLYTRLMGFPDELPDLRLLRPPDGNDRPEGLEQSYFVQRERGILALHH